MYRKHEKHDDAFHFCLNFISAIICIYIVRQGSLIVKYIIINDISRIFISIHHVKYSFTKK